MFDMERTEWFIVAALVIVSILMDVGMYYDEKAQDRYQVQHHCQVKGHANPTNGIGFGSKGQPVLTFNPDLHLRRRRNYHTIGDRMLNRPERVWLIATLTALVLGVVSLMLWAQHVVNQITGR